MVQFLVRKLQHAHLNLPQATTCPRTQLTGRYSSQAERNIEICISYQGGDQLQI